MSSRESVRLRNGLSAAALVLFAAGIAYIALDDVPPPQPPPPSPEAVQVAAPRPLPAERVPARQLPRPAETIASPAPPPEPEPAAESGQFTPIPNILALNRRVGAFQDNMARYRARNPVFTHFVNMLDEVLLPLVQNGMNAMLDAESLGIQKPAMEKSQEGEQAVLALLRDLAVESLELAESGELDLEDAALTQLRHLVEESESAAAKPVVNPYPAGSLDHRLFEASVGGMACLASRSFFSDFLQYGSPELEQERDFLDEEYRRLAAGNPDAAGFSIDADVYEDLVRERLQYLEDLDDWLSEAEEQQIVVAE